MNKMSLVLLGMALPLGSGALTASAYTVNFGTFNNNFTNSGQLDFSNDERAIGVGNVADRTIAGHTFIHDAPTTQTTSVVPITGYSVSNGKSYNQNLVTLKDGVGSTTSADALNLDQLVDYNRFGNNGSTEDFFLATNPGSNYELELLIWDNYYNSTSNPETTSRNETISLNGNVAVTAFNTVNDLGGPYANTAFLYKDFYTAPLTGPNSTSLDIHFGGGSPVLNAIILIAPEPASLGMLGLGAVTLLRRRRLA